MKNAVCALLTCTLLVLLVSSRVIGQKRATGIVERISGVAFLKQAGAAKRIKLDPRSDFARPLFPGDKISCGKGGRVTVRLVNNVEEVSETSGWFTIPGHVPSRLNPVQKALDEYGLIGGRDKGIRSNVIVFLPDESVVRPSTFVIRWIRLKKKCFVSIVIQEPGGKELWRQDNINGMIGVLDSAAARLSLSDYRSKVDGGMLLMNLVNSCGNSDQVTFTLLSAGNEQPLKEELAHWEKESDKLLVHLGRASVFIAYKLFTEAAEEYEAALALAPHSRNLLIRTISEQRRAGNFVRAKELGKALSFQIG